MSLSQEATKALERLDQLGYVWQTLTDLAIPNKDLDCVNRDHLALALDFLTKEYLQAQATLSAALREGGQL